MMRGKAILGLIIGLMTLAHADPPTKPVVERKPEAVKNDTDEVDPDLAIEAGNEIEILGYSLKRKLYHLYSSSDPKGNDFYATPQAVEEAIAKPNHEAFVSKPQSLVGAKYELINDLRLSDPPL